MIYKYRILKSSWGIAIDIDFNIVPLVNIEIKNTFHIDSNVYLSISDKSINTRIEEIIKIGIKDVVNFIILNNSENICIILKSITYNITDFQEEGMYCAIQDSIYFYYKSPPLNRDIEFDTKNNTYIFKNVHIR